MVLLFLLFTMLKYNFINSNLDCNYCIFYRSKNQNNIARFVRILNKSGNIILVIILSLKQRLVNHILVIGLFNYKY